MKHDRMGRLTRLGSIFTLLIVLSVGLFELGCSSKKTDTTDAAAKTEASEVQEEEGQAKEEAAQSEEPTEDVEASAESDAQDSSLPSDYIRPEFQEFIDSYIAFYQEYADYMNLYNEDPTNMELLTQMSEMINREADMVRAMDGWEAEDLTQAEQALLLEAEAEALRLSAGALSSM